MKILITGGLGFIGSHTCSILLKDGHHLVVIDDLSNSSVEVLSRLKFLSGNNLDFFKGSILNKTLLNNVFQKYKFETVIHFAGLKSVSESVHRPLDYYNVNVVGTISLLGAMKAHGTKKIIFSSSATVYGSNSPLPYKETQNNGKISNPYGKSKAIIEGIIEDQAKIDKKFNAVILRYFNPIGAHESGLLGECPNGPPNNLLPIILEVANKKRKYLSIFGNNYKTIDGTCRRDYIHVMDVAEGHINALNADIKGFEIFNLGTGIPYSVLEVINCFEKINNLKINYKISKRRDGDLAEFWADPLKANTTLEWFAKRDLDTMMLDSWKWQSKNPNGYKQLKSKKIK